MRSTRNRLVAILFATLLLSGLPMLAEEDYSLHLGGATFDPLVDPLPGDIQWLREPAGYDLQLVQFEGPIHQTWLDALEAAGTRVVQYIHPYTYVVWDDLDKLQDSTATLPSVRWVGHFQPAFRMLPQWQSGGPTGRYHALLFTGGDPDLALDALDALGAQLLSLGSLDERFIAAELRLTPKMLSDAAAVPGVYTIQPEPNDGGPRSELSSQVNAGNVDPAGFAFPGYQNWLTGVGLDGSGVTIASVDTGADDSHLDLVARCVPCTGDSCSEEISDHGTLAAGIMVGDGTTGIEDGNEFLRGLGVAPGASVVLQVYDDYFNRAGGMLELIRQSWSNGASLSGNSWGSSGATRGYDQQTMQVDMGVRDADASAPGNQSLTYVLSVMNGGGGISSQGAPDEAKNAFTVGSTKLQRFNGEQNPNLDDLSANTAHGPALDGRTLPDLVAPGCLVDSTRPEGQHGLYCGTSMAAPQVAGAVALFVEHYRAMLEGADPSPALVKAAFLPVARSLAGHRDADGQLLGHPMDSRQGWGRLALDRILAPAAPAMYYDAPTVLDETGDEWTVDIVTLDPTEPFKLMLVWTDAPGHGLAGATPAWANDLDLIVVEDEDVYRGNAFAEDGYSSMDGEADRRNNAEGVFLPPAEERQLSVRVRASNLTSDGVPGLGDRTDQDFALVCYNCSAPPRLGE